MTYDESKTVEATIEVPVQVCGKLRSTVKVPADADAGSVIAAAKSDEKIREILIGKNIIKEIYVKNKILNIVAK